MRLRNFWRVIFATDAYAVGRLYSAKEKVDEVRAAIKAMTGIAITRERAARAHMRATHRLKDWADHP